MVDLEAKTEAGRALRKEAARWLERIAASQQREKKWRDDAYAAEAAYTGEGVHSDETEGVTGGAAYDFNILFSNVETIVPATINSAPSPDIRRRFGNEDPVAKDLAEILERAIRVQIDDGKLQVEMEAEAQDAFLAGRGVIRLRFKSDFVKDGTDGIGKADVDAGVAMGGDDADEGDLSEPLSAVDGMPAGDVAGANERPANERITFEAVSWKDLAHGPAKRWCDVRWWAFRHVMEFEDEQSFQDIPLVTDQTAEGDVEEDKDTDREVWEIWERRTRRVIFVSKNSTRIIKRVDDPLGLSGFFPNTTPVQPIEINGRLMPVNPFAIYRKLAEELDITTKRIRVITKQLKVKGWYGISATDMGAILSADDNEFTPISDPELWAAKGGLEQAIVYWPVEKLVLVLAELYKLREQTKQAIYEITGISDIVRGASKSSETATAQNIKNQWGSLRIQKMQRMLERSARELFLMMAEIIPAKFSAQTLQRITGVQIEPTEQDLQPAMMGHNGGPPMDPQMPPEQAAAMQVQQAQQMQAAEQARQEKLAHLAALQNLMKEPPAAYYRIDVETDSTIRADLTRQKQEATEFMTAASGYFAAVGPLVQQGALPMEVAVEIFASFSRMFNLGKTVEDALDEMVKKAKEAAGQPQQPNPEAEAAKAEREQKAKDAEADRAIKTQDAEVDRTIKVEGAAADAKIKAVDLQIKQADLFLKQRQVMVDAFNGTASPAGAIA